MHFASSYISLLAFSEVMCTGTLIILLLLFCFYHFIQKKSLALKQQVYVPHFYHTAG